MALYRKARNDRSRAAESLYLTILSRRPTVAELEAITKYARNARLSPKQVADDLVWALINTKEFLYRH